MKHLNPGTPASTSAGNSAALPRTTPPHGCPVDPRVTTCRGALGFEGCDVCGFGQAVKRHVDQSRDATGGCGARGCVETLPSAAGIVDVDVRVDQAGENDQIPKVVEFHGTHGFVPGANRDDLFALHDQRGGGESVPGQDAS